MSFIWTPRRLQKQKEAARPRIVQHQPRDDPEAKLKLT